MGAVVWTPVPGEWSSHPGNRFSGGVASLFPWNRDKFYTDMPLTYSDAVEVLRKLRSFNVYQWKQLVYTRKVQGNENQDTNTQTHKKLFNSHSLV